MKNLLINRALAAKKKKIFTLLLAVAASVGTMFAEKVKIGDLYYNLDAATQTAEVTSQYGGYSGDIVIPSSVTYKSVSYSVTSIGGWAFRDCTGLTSVTISNSVTSIVSYAFQSCSSLTSVTISNSVTSIVSYAFQSCSSLTSVTISNSVTSIVSYAFQSCSSLTSVTIGNSVENIGSGAFYDCTGLTSVTIPNSVTSIGGGAFSGCTSLTSVTLNSNTIVGKEYQNPSSIKLIFGEQVTEYILGDEITSIGRSAFEGCTSLTSVTIPNSVTSIGSSAFEGCTSLTSVTIPNSVTSIGSSAFEGCTSLTSVTIPNSVTSIGWDAFSGCTSLTSVTIPNSVTSIEGGAFYYCTGLTSVTIPNSVTSIGIRVFSRCSSLTSLSVKAGNTVYDSRNNCNAIIKTATNTLIFGSKNTTIPNTVTSIGDYAFSYCSGLTSVTIPNSVTSIGDYAFEHCSGLTSVTIPNSVTSIGNYAFDDCYGLTSVTIPNSVTSIGKSAFAYCRGLKNVILGTSVKVLEEYAFYNCSSIETITCYSMRPPTVNNNAFDNLDYSTIVYVPADYLNTYKMHDAWGLYDVRPLGAKTTETTNLSVTPAETTADVAWPQVSGAATYELVIKDKSGNVICTLVFNANGQLTQIAFNAPARNNAPQQTQAAGFSFTVTGLESGTSYDLTITSKDNSGTTLDTKTISFTTSGEALQGIDQVQSTKVIKNGQLFILRGDKTYTLTGQETIMP